MIGHVNIACGCFLCGWIRKLVNLLARPFYPRSLAFFRVKEEFTGANMSCKLVKPFVKVLKSRKYKEDDPLDDLIQLLEENRKTMDAHKVARVTNRLKELLYEKWSEEEQWALRYVKIMLCTFYAAQKEGCGIAVH